MEPQKSGPGQFPAVKRKFRSKSTG